MLRFFFSFCAFPRCHHCFRFHLVEEASRPHIIFFLPPFTLFGRETVTFFVPVLVNPEERRHRLSSAMGDIEAPGSNRPPQTVLLSILPSKEFATSRKGMLLIAEVVRTESGTCGTNKAVALAFQSLRAFAFLVQCFLFCFVFLNVFSCTLSPKTLNMGQTFAVTRFPLVKGGALMIYSKMMWF